MAQDSRKRRLRIGSGRAWEASLYEFTGRSDDGQDAPVARIAAVSLELALGYLRENYGDFQIVRIEFLGMVRLVSGTPVD